MSDERPPYTLAEIDDLRERVDTHRALSAAIDRWPEVSHLASTAASPGLLVSQLCELLGVDETGAKAVTEIQLRRVTVEHRTNITAQLDEMEAELARALARGDD